MFKISITKDQHIPVHRGSPVHPIHFSLTKGFPLTRPSFDSEEEGHYISIKQRLVLFCIYLLPRLFFFLSSIYLYFHSMQIVTKPGLFIPTMQWKLQILHKKSIYSESNNIWRLESTCGRPNQWLKAGKDDGSEDVCGPHLCNHSP